MSALTRRKGASSTETNVLPFPRLYEEPSETDALSRASSVPATATAEFHERIKTAIDAFLTEAYIGQLLRGSIAPESPFDAVFISALVPDAIERQDVTRVSAFSHVRDLSDSIAFFDDWAD